MENKAHALAAGAFVLLMLALLGGLAFWLTREDGQRHLYEISTTQNVAYLQPQSLVRYRGVEVGRVEVIGFDAEQPGHVLLRLSIDSQAPLTRSSYATIALQGVTGLGYVQIEDESPQSPRLAVNDADPPRIPLKPGLLDQLLGQSQAILAQMSQASAGLSQWLNSDNPASAQAAVRQLGDAASSLNRLAATLEPTAKSLPALSRQGMVTLQSLEQAAQGVSATTEQLGQTVTRINEPNGPLAQMAQGSAALAQTIATFGAATLPKLGEVADETTRAMRQLRRTVNAVDENPQALIFGNGPAAPGPGEEGFVAPEPQR